jgi:4-cresol dehydrogenase (hydroxylating)
MVVAEQFGWGDHAARHLQQTIKDAVDPHGILSPGKQGIWPSSRRRRWAR